MRVLVGCESSGVVREAFRSRGHDAWSCDLQAADDRSPYHYQGDVFEVIGKGWDLAIFHPPCTHLAVSGARHFEAKRADGRQQEALQFVRDLMGCPVKRWAIENPVGIISSEIRKPDQTIHPWQFGHKEQKATCLWLHGLPCLTPVRTVWHDMMALDRKYRERIHRMPPGEKRWKERSRTYEGIAGAMASQWGEAYTTELFDYA